jgi:O-antigen ligase
MAINAILQHHQGRGFGDSEPLWRIRNRLTGEGVYQARGVGTFEDPNDLCLVLVVGISLFYAHFRLEPNPVWKAIALAGLALCGYGAWCTNSRGGIVAIFGMLAAYAIVRTKGLRRYLMAATAISIVTVLAPSRFGGSMVGRDRSILWGDGLAMFKANPLFGVGYGDFTSYSSEHLVAHNTYIHTLAELGIVGYLPLFLLLYLTMIQLRRTIQCKDLISKQDYFLLTGLFSALSGYFVGMYFLSRQYQHILYLMLSLAITAVHVIASRYGLTEKIFGQTRRDVRYGLLWGAASILVLWSSTRFVNAIS